MAIKLNESVRLCTILTVGPVAALGGISGPITRCKLTNKQIVSIMRSGHKVAEYNPDKPGEYVELTLDNNGASPFKNAPKVVAPAAPVKEPVVNEKSNTEDTVPVEDPVEEEPEPVEDDPVEFSTTVIPEDVVPAEESATEDKTPEEDPAEESKEETEEQNTPAPKKEITINVNTSKGSTGGKKSKKTTSGNSAKK